MGNRSTEDLNKHMNNAIECVQAFIKHNIAGDIKAKGRADKFCYWLEDYTRFLNTEPSFSPSSLKRYKRGDVLSVHLGFNVGSEEGGLHYCVVVEKENSVNNPTITVVPLTSVKSTTDINKLRPSNIYLGNDIFTATDNKLSRLENALRVRYNAVANELKHVVEEDIVRLTIELNTIKQQLNSYNRAIKAFSKMSLGSIALVNQITTVSKIRIYDPRTNNDPLSGIRLSNEKLDMIDAQIVKQYTKGI